jgi:hypothetical protein
MEGVAVCSPRIAYANVGFILVTVTGIFFGLSAKTGTMAKASISKTNDAAIIANFFIFPPPEVWGVRKST